MPGTTPKTRIILLALACSLLTGSAHFLIKWGADRSARLGWFDLSVLAPVAAAYLLMGVGFLLLLLALRTGALSTVYPVIAARHIWMVALSPMLFATESWNLYKIAGATLVAVGVSLVARADSS
jgi:multidrug transporter EmrE-like cation transporter